jgi:hypothetical protein
MSQIDQNDPRLTAYALDEMSAAERAEFERLLRDDPAARATVDDLRRTAALLADALATEPLPERSVEIRPSHRQPHWLRRLVTESWTIWVPLGAVACFALFFWRVYLPEYQRRQDAIDRSTASANRPSGIPVEGAAVDFASNTADSTSADSSAPASHLPTAPTGLDSAGTTIKTGYFLTARQNPTSRFAVNVGTAAYADVRRSLEAGELPPTGLVRIEELVNSFRYSYPLPTGGAPLALSTEMHAAPWSDSHLLVRIGLQGREVPAAIAAVPGRSSAVPAAVAQTPAPSLASERPLHEARDLLTASVANEIRTPAARDVKVQVDFNPAKVLAYRLIGYENRLIKGDDAEAVADNDLAAGRSVTALYEIIPLPAPAARRTVAAAKPAPPPTPNPADTDEWLTVKLRYSEPGVARSRSVIVPLHANVVAEATPATPDFKFAAAVAGFGLILQDNPNKGTATWDMVEELAKAGIATGDTAAVDQRRGFVSLVRKARSLAPDATPAEVPVSKPASTSTPGAH